MSVSATPKEPAKGPRGIEKLVVLFRSGLAVLATVFWTTTAIVLYPVWKGSGVACQPRWARSVLRCVGVRVKVVREVALDPPVIYTANHQSTLDILTLFSQLEGLRFVSKIELAKAPLIGPCMRIGGHIFLDRGRSRQTVRALKDAAEDIREIGRSVVIFPEGTRYADGELGPFKRGAILLARSCRIPIVPVGIVGTPDLMAPDAFLARAGEVVINIGSPIDTEDYRGRDPELIERLRREITRLAEYPGPSPKG